MRHNEDVLMKAKTIIILSFLLLSQLAFSAEIAVIPYRVLNSSKYFKQSTGEEYARILSVAGVYKKQIRVTSLFDLKKDMKRIGLSTSRLISKDDLLTLGRVHRIDYFLLGSLVRRKGLYVSKSVLFSVKEKRVLIRSQFKSRSLFKLAEIESYRMFLPFSNRRMERKNNKVDLVFVMDLSYNSSIEWPAVRNKIHSLTARLIDSYGLNVHVKFIPWSRYKTPSYYSRGHITGLKKYLYSLRPRGRGSRGSFQKALSSALQNSSWRKKSHKALMVISNTPLKDSFLVDRYALLARRRGVPITTMTLGRLSGKNVSQLWRLSYMTEGKNYRASYYQKIYDIQGEPLHLLLENGRLFSSSSYEESWIRGLLKYNSYNMSYSVPHSWLDEVLFSGSIIPQQMSRTYIRKKHVKILKKRKIKHNAAYLLDRGISSALKSVVKLSEPLGRVLVTDGGVSLWLSIDAKEMMKNISESNDSIYLSGYFLRDKLSAYGITFKPLLLDIKKENIPKKMIVTLKKAIRRRNYYIRNGLFKPGLWFIRVKVVRKKSIKEKKDIRDF